VPEQIRHRLDVDPRFEPRHGGRVPQRVHADTLHAGGAAATSITRSRLRGSTGAPSSVVTTQRKPPLIRRAQPLGLLCGAMLAEHRHDRRVQLYGPPKGGDYLVASLIRSLVDCERRGNTRRAAADLIGGPVFTVRCREVVNGFVNETWRNGRDGAERGVMAGTADCL